MGNLRTIGRTKTAKKAGKWMVRALIAAAAVWAGAMPVRAENERVVAVEPLIKTKWAQGSPFNKMLPEGDYGTYSRRTGCMATAMAQIINYHRRPARGSGQSEPYTTSIGLQVPSINFDVAYDWDNMLNVYTSRATEQQVNAVAELMFHVGVSIEMNYGRSGSTVRRIPLALVNRFGYDRSIQRHERRFYSDAAWDAVMKKQLGAGLPVFLWGSFPGGDGHAYVVDGYDNTGKFHFNCGWGGVSDGYYFMNAITSQKYTFGENHVIIANIKPDEGGKSNYEMALLAFTADKASVFQNELLTVTAGLYNMSALEAFPGGQVGAALVDNDGNIVSVIGSANTGLRNPSTAAAARAINCFVPGAVTPGQYQLRIVTKVEGGEWEVVALSAIRDGVPFAIDLTVTPEKSATPGGGYGMGLATFTASKTTVSPNEQFTVDFTLRNIGQEIFPGGQSGVALVDNDGNIIDVLGISNTGLRNPGGQTSLITRNITIPNTVTHGQYQLRIVIRPTNGEWRIATLSYKDCPTSFDFHVGALNSPASPVSAPSGNFTVIPNPVVTTSSSGTVAFFWQGQRLVGDAALPIYDASGKVVNGIEIKDPASASTSKRRVASWRLRDLDGRPVPKGRYTVRGVLTTSTGEKERVEVQFDVR
jgi:hypothetical protein